MANQLSQQHPAVVLRSQYNHLRLLLAAAVIAVVALAASVVILAVDAGSETRASSSPAAVHEISQSPRTRYDGGPEEGTAGPFRTPSHVSTRRYDGGPEEGTRGLGH